jgi:tetratricopeptide (TPR) repeat protein
VLIGTAVLAGLVWLIFFNGQSRDSIPVIRTNDQYEDVLKDAQAHSEKEFARFDGGNELSSSEKDNVRHAALDFEGAIAYEPEKYTNYFGAGKCYYVLGDYNRALDRLAQCMLKQNPIGESNDYYIQTLSEAHYLSSLILFEQHRYDLAARDAEIAANYVPQSALYPLAQARAELQLGHEDKARHLVEQALNKDPQNPGANQLARFLRAGPYASVQKR